MQRLSTGSWRMQAPCLTANWSNQKVAGTTTMMMTCLEDQSSEGSLGM